MEQNTERIWNLIARKLSGDASPEELAELELLLLQSPRENYSMEILNDLWNSKSQLNRQYSENKYRELVLRMQQAGIDEGRFTDNDSITLKNNEPAKKRSKKWFLWMASLLLISSVAFLLWQKKQTGTDAKQPDLLAKNEISTKYGSKTTLVLPDGTKVWLNAGSKMTYDKNYGVQLREVNLTGEAYFDVVKNTGKPFIIHTSQIDIKVLGTAFNVRCYPDEKNTETSLVRGSLEVSLKDRQEKIILKPNEKLVISNNEAGQEKETAAKTVQAIIQPANVIELGHLSLLPQDNSIVETSWVNNKLVFRSETFEELALKMQRWYAVNIIFKDERIKTKRFTGIFENEGIAEALSALKLTTPFSYSIDHEKIIISK